MVRVWSVSVFHLIVQLSEFRGLVQERALRMGLTLAAFYLVNRKRQAKDDTESKSLLRVKPGKLPESPVIRLTPMNARSARFDRLWIARAINSFPVPVYPRIKTVESDAATLATWRSTFRSASEEPTTMSSNIAELTWAASRKESRIARTVVLKLKAAEFKILTRSHTPSSPPSSPPSSCEELTTIAQSLRERVLLGPEQRFRFVGVGLSNFLEPEDLSAQAALFD
jgi:hypothetical protein